MQLQPLLEAHELFSMLEWTYQFQSIPKLLKVLDEKVLIRETQIWRLVCRRNEQNGVTCAVKKKQESARTRGHRHPRSRSALKPEATDGGLQRLSKLFLILQGPTEVSDRLGSSFTTKQGTFKKSVVDRPSFLKKEKGGGWGRDTDQSVQISSYKRNKF